MKDKNRACLHKDACRFFPRWKALSWCGAVLLVLVTACAREPLPPPAAPWPSRVITQAGVLFTVHRFRLPGTTQEITIKVGDAKQWMPLNLVQAISFTGREKRRYRQAEIMLISGEKLKGEVFVGTLVEGTTDLGYWNMPFSEVERVDMGSD